MSNPMPDGFEMIYGHNARTDENRSRDAHVSKSSYRPGCYDTQTLTDWQGSQGRTWRSVEVMESIYGWYVRASSGLDGFAIMASTIQRGGKLDGTYEDAAKWAIEWCRENPMMRYAYVRTSALARAKASH